ncbi:unnamed protein product [Rotaria sp. Silwood2]|nr:unnamed protein product [Rotaria sp. Silwood2]
MNTHTQLEDLSNEIFFEIFEYFDALEIFTIFTSLNRRISSIIQSISLRIVIFPDHCYRQINFLSSHLIHHADQVISLEIFDTIRDYSSIINLIFNRHRFLNIESCIFYSINSTTILENVFKQIKDLNRLVSFSFYALNDGNITEKNKHDLTQIMLLHKSPDLRSISLLYRYTYMDISNLTSIPSNLIRFRLCISSSLPTLPIYSIISILRLCHTIRYLGITIENQDQIENNTINISNSTPSINDNNLPMLLQVISFDLKILAKCDSRSIASILHCMPNLVHFCFALEVRLATWPFPGELLNGYMWREMIERYVRYLSKFEFDMSIRKTQPRLDLDIVVNSFEYFVQKYSNWNMIIERWNFYYCIRGIFICLLEEFIMLRTNNYCKYKESIDINMPFIHSGLFDIRSTTTDHPSLFYSDTNLLRIHLTKDRPIVTWSGPLYQQIKHLVIVMPTRGSPLWNNLLNIFNFHETNDDNIDAKESVTHLSHFVYLPNITQLEFPSMNCDLSRWKDIQFILQACPNLIDLIINTPLLISSKFINNSSLIPIFKQIKMITSVTEKIYFPSKLTSKLVQHFPSLSHIELQVFSFDDCISIIEIFLSRLENLSYIKISYSQDTLVDDPFSRQYLMKKRRQTFPNNILDEQMINVKNNGEAIQIWLS